MQIGDLTPHSRMFRRPLRAFLPLVALVPALFGEEIKAPATAVEKPSASTLGFIRTKAFQDQVSGLQTLSQQYLPANGAGPVIWLVGVAHLGTQEYYGAIQKRLDAQSSVLYEGVGGEKLAKGARIDSDAGLQSQLAKALGLIFQLDAIDYQRPNFENSDMTPERLNEAIARRSAAKSGGKSKPADPAAPSEPACTNPADPAVPPKVDNETYKMLMDAIHGEGEMAETMGAMTAMIGSTPEMRETTKLMLLEALGQAGELLDLAKAMSPELKDLFEVLITERNAEVVAQLEAKVKKLQPDQSVAVFYGAAHMDEIATRLTDHLNYKPGAQLWDTAFTANGAKSIMQPAQIKMMMQMMRTQMQNPGAPGPDANSFPLLNLFGPAPGTPPAPGVKPKAEDGKGSVPAPPTIRPKAPAAVR
jgi:hypothetical protein